MTGMVSIIVPIYNCEKWLPVCFESLINQTYPNLEIILVNDGSTDNSLSICQEYAKKDERIHLLNKKNGGVSSARNEGLQYVTGEWITFVDADDWLELDAIEKVCCEVQGNFDFCFWDIVHTYMEKESWKPQYLHHAAMEDIYCTIISGRTEKGYHIGSLARGAGAKLFRSEIIKKHRIHFDENLYIGEDAVFILEFLRCLSGVDRIKVADICCYHYRILDTSAVHRYKSDLFKQSLHQLNAIQQFLNEEQLSSNRKIRTSLMVFCWGIFHNLLINELQQTQDNRNAAKWKEAIYWLQYNNRTMRLWNVEFRKMPRFVRLEWIYSRFLSEEKICQMTAYYLKKKKENDLCKT